jgi:hypothetical protein
MVKPLLRASDLIALVPGRALSIIGRDGLAVVDPPVPVAGFPLQITRHARRDGDPAVRHGAGLIEKLTAAL